LGNTNRAEFEQARTALSDWGTVCECPEANSAAAALAEGNAQPDVIVVAQAFPGQFSHRMLDQLRRLAPLARVVGLMGSWCEGEMRTGSPWPGAVRTYWHQWTARCNRELRQLADGGCCSWTLPPTATEEERLLVDAKERWPPCQGLVIICGRSLETADWLSAACRSRGFATVWQRPPVTAKIEGAKAAIFDGAQLSEEQCGDLHRLATSLEPVPVVALLAFPRVEDHRRALSAGAAAVISKPLAVDDLFWELDRVASG
jgi:CheY-like chemotaxis protein